jgi:predicted metalloprotease with PDZ domain
MIRDFARNIVEISAETAAGPLSLEQIDKSSYRLPPLDQAVIVRYRVYAWDLSVRGAHLDLTHGFFNGTSLFLEVVGQGNEACRLVIEPPRHADCCDWELATALPRVEGADFGFGAFMAENYAQLIDCPVEMGRFRRFGFEVAGVPHHMVLTGRFDCDEERLKADLERICRQQIGLFGGAAPFDSYLFLVMVTADGYGGLEHRNSTALMCARDDLPQPGLPADETSESYRRFLGLCSHEYFHSWNVKRITPAVFVAPDLSREVYTPLLWAFEGITSYYDDLMLLRSGCITLEQYLELLARTLTRVRRSPGRLRQSVAESSFNAWTRFYKQDENAPNAIISYYAKGCLIALAIDLRLRQRSGGRLSLDDVMRSLWRDWLDGRRGIDEQTIQQRIGELLGEDLGDELAAWIEQPGELPLEELLATLSLRLEWRAPAGSEDKGGGSGQAAWRGWLGATFKEEEGGLRLQHVIEDSPAQQAGLSAGDLLIAIDGLRASRTGHDRWLRLADLEREYELLAFRRDELIKARLRLAPAPADTACIEVLDADAPALRQWMGR